MNPCQINQRAVMAAPVVESHSTDTRTPARPFDDIPAPRYSRRDLARMAAMVAGYVVEQATRRMTGEDL